jgi:hypothetical protein
MEDFDAPSTSTSSSTNRWDNLFQDEDEERMAEQQEMEVSTSHFKPFFVSFEFQAWQQETAVNAGIISSNIKMH